MTALVPEVLPATIEEFADRIRELRSGSATAVVQIGLEFLSAKRTHGHGALRDIAGRVGLTVKQVGCYLSIARNAALVDAVSDPEMRHQVPVSMGSLYELSRVPAGLLRSALETSTIYPGMERHAALRVARSLTGRRAIRSVREVIGDELDRSGSPDPHDVTDEVIGALAVVGVDAEPVRPFLGQMIRSVATSKARTGSRERIALGSREWKWLDECTADDLYREAEMRRRLASENTAAAERLELLAAGLVEVAS